MTDGRGAVDGGSVGDGEPDTDRRIADLREAREAVSEVESSIAEIGESRVEAVAEAYDRATELLDRYEDRAVGTGDFEAYVEFQDRFLTLVEELPDDLPERGAFESASDRLDRRRLRERDFGGAREDLHGAEEVASLPAERERARERLATAERDAERRLDAVGERIAELERLVRLGDADLDAPVAELREPVESYNDAVRGAFGEFRRTASARELFDFVETTGTYPLVGFREPPAELLAYVREYPAGEEPVPELLEYADYSKSKLEHYVDDAAALKRRVAVHRTYLERLDAAPLTVSWPPPAADELRYVARELVAVVGRFADEETVALARDLRELADHPEYERLRTAADARESLTDGERERLASGAVGAELESLRDERERLERALSEPK